MTLRGREERSQLCQVESLHTAQIDSPRLLPGLMITPAGSTSSLRRHVTAGKGSEMSYYHDTSVQSLAGTAAQKT